MSRSVIAITLALAITSVSAVPASAGAPPDEPERTYVRYAKVRDQLIGCSIDRGWRHLGAEKRKRCRTLRRRYALYSRYGAISTTFIICKTSRCPAGPDGVPNPRGPAPAIAVRVYG
jgi:hypothetical protein